MKSIHPKIGFHNPSECYVYQHFGRRPHKVDTITDDFKSAPRIFTKEELDKIIRKYTWRPENPEMRYFDKSIL